MFKLLTLSSLIITASLIKAEGIASINDITADTINSIPTHKLFIECEPDPNNPDLLNVRLKFTPEKDYVIRNVMISIHDRAANDNNSHIIFKGSLTIKDNITEFSLSKNDLEKIALAYMVPEHDYAVHYFSLKASHIIKLAEQAAPRNR